MTPQEIRDAIAASPELQALGQDTQAIADALSVGRTKVVSRMTSARGLAELMPGGPFAAEVVLMKLEGTAATLAASTDQQEKVLASLRATDIAMTIDASGFTNGAYGVIYNDTDANKRAIGFVELSSAGTLSLVAGGVTIDWGGAGTDLLTLTQS